jgi:hypothetical protein
MNRRSVRSVALLFFALAVFARQSTGAPNVQVSFTDVGKIQYSKSVASLQQAGPSIQELDESTTIDPTQASLDSKEQHYKNYKKYVSPDRNLEFGFELNHSARETLARAPTETLLLSSLPQVQRAQAPPVADVSFTHIGTSFFKGVYKFESHNSHQRSGGFGHNGLRTP